MISRVFEVLDMALNGCIRNVIKQFNSCIVGLIISDNLVAKLILAHYSWNKYVDDVDHTLETKACSLVRDILKFHVEEDLLSAVCFVWIP